MYWYNTNYHDSTKTTPFHALYDGEPPSLLRGNSIPTSIQEVNKLVQERDLMLEEIREQLLKAQNRMKVQADKHHRELELKVGEKVYLKIQPYKLKSLAKRQNQKLSPHFYGPFEVLERVGPAAYMLLLPQGTSIHPVFHVSLLKRCVSPSASSQPLPKYLSEDWELKVSPEEIIATRVNDAGQEELLVKWPDLLAFENSWELKSNFQQEFPDFHLGTRWIFRGGVLLETPSMVKLMFVRELERIGPTQAHERESVQNSKLLGLVGERVRGSHGWHVSEVVIE